MKRKGIMSSEQSRKRVLLLYFSFSSQTKNLLHSLAAGLEKEGCELRWERIHMTHPMRFPIGSIPRTVWVMLLTFLRKRYPIEPISEQCYEYYDLILLAGPTWSYNPSGPVLSLLDRYGSRIFQGKRVLPLISCRGYWRMHWWGLRRLLQHAGADVVNLIVFAHPSPEPWRTIGVFLKLAGRVPERMWLRKYYPKYGHSREQLGEAQRFGSLIGQALVHNDALAALDFRTTTALP